MGNLIIAGVRHILPGIDIATWEDDPLLTLAPEDGRYRPDDTLIDLITTHTTSGEGPQILRPGRGPGGTHAERVVRYWTTSKTKKGDKTTAGAQLILDYDATWVQTCDLRRRAAFHAGCETNPGVNGRSIGIEIAINAKGELYEGQMESYVAMMDALSRLFDVPREYAAGVWPIPNLVDQNFPGCIGHRDVGNRGAFDPGPIPYTYLQRAGYLPTNVQAGEHIARWKERQGFLNAQAIAAGLPVLKVDGIRGPKTQAYARRFKGPIGQWVDRPGDDVAIRTQ